MQAVEDVFAFLQVPSEESFEYATIYEATQAALSMQKSQLRAFVYNALPRFDEQDLQEFMWTFCERASPEMFEQFQEFYTELSAKLQEIQNQWQEDVDQLEWRLAQQREAISQQPLRAASEHPRANESIDEDYE